MINNSSPSPNLALFSGFKLVIMITGMVWTLNQIFPFFSGSGARISAYGDYSPLQFPDPARLELTNPKGERISMKSLWRFSVKNDGSKEAANLTFELPFDGFYQIKTDGKITDPKPADFQRNIRLNPLSPSDEVSVMVWSDKAVDPSYEKETRISSPDGTVSINYPVKVTGVLAWAERSKLLISIILLIALFTLLL